MIASYESRLGHIYTLGMNGNEPKASYSYRPTPWPLIITSLALTYVELMPEPLMKTPRLRFPHGPQIIR